MIERALAISRKEIERHRLQALGELKNRLVWIEPAVPRISEPVIRTCSGISSAAWAIWTCATCWACAASTFANVNNDADPIRVASLDVIGFTRSPQVPSLALSKWWSDSSQLLPLTGKPSGLSLSL